MSYAELLSQYWADATAPRADNAPTVISTFAGGGGSSTGYHMAGYRELLAVEWERDAVETLRLNYPHLPIYHGDIAKLSGAECMRLAGIKPGELDLFDGSPPCQGFSTTGKRMMDDPRNQLFREYTRLLKELQPRTFVMENVSGMVKGKMKLMFAEILAELKSCGYQVSARLLDSQYFGVPQARERMIFIGVRNDLGVIPSHPKPQTQPLTVAQAWVGLTESSDAPTLTPLYQQYWHAAKQGAPVGKLAVNKKLISSRPSFTLAKNAGGSPPYHPTECRSISTAERKRLGSFPDPYRFTGRVGAIDRIGNSVPPLMARAIGLHVRQLLEQAAITALK